MTVQQSLGYENAPATMMLATHCVCCGRALVDAVSVECGMGETCRTKHGFYDATPLTPVTKGPFGVGTPEVDGAVGTAVDSNNLRRAANVLVHFAAANQRTTAAVLAGWRVRQLGFDRLSTAILRRNAAIEITVADGWLWLRCPYSEEFNRLRRTERALGGSFIPGKPTGKWRISDTPDARRALVRLLNRVWPDAPIVTPTVLLAGGRRFPFAA